MIASILYTHEMLYNFTANQPWHSVALQKHRAWAESQNQNYLLVTNEMVGDWKEAAGKYAYTWAFGTLLKYVALNAFLESSDDYFLFLDLDVLPTASANYEYYRSSGDCIYHYPSSNFITDRHQQSKYIWNKYKSEKYDQVLAALFGFTRDGASLYLNWMNQDHKVGTKNWWDARERRLELGKPLLRLVGIEYDWYATHGGNDEFYFEEAFNSGLFKHFRQLTWFDVANNDLNREANFIHYHGSQKQKISKRVLL